jgi:hypothetical protein
VQQRLNRARPGRPHGQPAQAETRFLSEAQQTLALPFCQGRIGLHRLKATLAVVTNYHVAAGRGEWLERILLSATEESLRARKTRPSFRGKP